MGELGRAKRSGIFTIALLIVTIVLAAAPVRRGSALVLLFVWYFMEQRPQAKFLKEREIRYVRKSWLKPVCVGIAAVVFVLGVLTGIACLFE